MRTIATMLVLAALAMMTAQAAYAQERVPCFPGSPTCIDGDTGEEYPNPAYDPNFEGTEGLPPATVTPTATPSATVTATATNAAQAQYGAPTELPATGGPPLSITAGVLLVASGLVARRVF